MVELKDKTVEELRKMASKKKIEGRSKMNKAELVRALKKKTSTKKTMKRRKMKGGYLTTDQLQDLLKNPQSFLLRRNINSPPEPISSVFRGQSPQVFIKLEQGDEFRCQISDLQITEQGAGGVSIISCVPTNTVVYPKITPDQIEALLRNPRGYLFNNYTYFPFPRIKSAVRQRVAWQDCIVFMLEEYGIYVCQVSELTYKEPTGEGELPVLVYLPYAQENITNGKGRYIFNHEFHIYN